MKKLSSIDCGANCVCESAVWGSNQLKDCSRRSKGQCASVSKKSNLNTSLNCSTTSPNCSTIFASLTSTCTINTSCNPITVVVKSFTFQNRIPRVVDWFVQCPWEQSSPLENSSIDEAMDGDKTSQKQMEAIWMLWFKWHHMIHLKL